MLQHVVQQLSVALVNSIATAELYYHVLQAYMRVSHSPIGSVTVSGLRIEESTAKFYLDLAQGNLKDAIELYEQDVAWEQKSKAKKALAGR